MRGCARAPVRVDPAGGGTDAPPFCIEHGGAVVNFSVQRHAFATAQKLEAGSGVVLFAMDLQQGVVAESVSELRDEKILEFVKAFIERMVPDNDSILLATETDVPPGSGLGGSGALGVAIVAAIDRAYGRERSPLETASLANEIERIDLGYAGGDQDSYGSALGGINYFQYHQGGGMTPHKLSVSNETICALQHGSLLIYSGEAHVSESIHEDIKRSYALEDSPTVKSMHALREQAQSMAKSLENGNLREYAAALGESCRQLYNLHESCNCPEHRKLFEAIDDCILGGKTCGSGGGGFVLVFTEPGRRYECRSLAEKLGGVVWPVTIDFEGVTCWLAPELGSEEVNRFRQLAARSD